MKIIVNLYYHGRLVGTRFQIPLTYDTGSSYVNINLDETVHREIEPEIVNETEANIACQLPPQQEIPVNDKRRPTKPRAPTP